MRQITPIFPIRAERVCVLLTTNSVRDRLADFELDTDAVITACREHRLAPAVDIGLAGRQLLRIVPSAVSFFAEGRSRSRRLTQVEFFAEVFRGLPQRSGVVEVITGERLRAILNCEGGHVNALVDAGELEVMPGKMRRDGPGGSDTIKLSSVKEFLKRRLT